MEETMKLYFTFGQIAVFVMVSTDWKVEGNIPIGSKTWAKIPLSETTLAGFKKFDYQRMIPKDPTHNVLNIDDIRKWHRALALKRLI